LKKNWTVDKVIAEFPAGQITQFGTLFSTRYIVSRSRTLAVWILKQVLNSWWDVIGQELIDGAIDQWFK